MEEPKKEEANRGKDLIDVKTCEHLYQQDKSLK